MILIALSEQNVLNNKVFTDLLMFSRIYSTHLKYNHANMAVQYDA